MILQSTLSPSTPHSLSSTVSYCPSFFPSGSRSFISFSNGRPFNLSIQCSVPQVYSYGTMDYEKRPMLKWVDIYKRISLMENPQIGVASVLNQCEKEGKKVNKWELCKIVRELRKFKRFKLALEVFLISLLFFFLFFFWVWKMGIIEDSDWWVFFNWWIFWI